MAETGGDSRETKRDASVHIKGEGRKRTLSLNFRQSEYWQWIRTQASFSSFPYTYKRNAITKIGLFYSSVHNSQRRDTRIPCQWRCCISALEQVIIHSLVTAPFGTNLGLQTFAFIHFLHGMGLQQIIQKLVQPIKRRESTLFNWFFCYMIDLTERFLLK